jgi:RIO-like serine/threonine protein kinase
MSICFHSLEIVHGDLNKYNFIVGPTKTTLIDFENATKNGGKEAMQKEFAYLTGLAAMKGGCRLYYTPARSRQL